MVLRIFKIVLRLRDRYVFMQNSLEILNVFNTLNLKQIFWKTQILFKKLEYHFLVESAKIENLTFPYKPALLAAIVTTNRMGITKRTHHKERIVASNWFIFSKILFQFKNLVKRVNLMYQPPKCSYLYFSKVLELVEGAFSPWVDLNKASKRLTAEQKLERQVSWKNFPFHKPRKI